MKGVFWARIREKWLNKSLMLNMELTKFLKYGKLASPQNAEMLFEIFQ